MRNRGHAVIAIGLTLAITALLTGCATALSGPAAFVVPAPPPSQAEYTVQAGDSLQILFYYHPDHNQNDVLVRNDGKILLPLVGEVQASGLTPAQISDDVAKKYSANLKDPKVSVSVKNVYQNRVYVGGEVNKPGFVQYRPGLTALQAVLEAGGPKDTADVKETVLLQKVVETQYRSSKLDLSKVINEGDTKADLVLGPSDVLFLPKTGIAKANVWMEQYVIRMLPIRISASPF